MNWHDIIFIQGGPGTGKSVIALHLIAYYGKGIISVPTKVLEDQYVEDYCGENKKHIKFQEKILRVNKMRGRDNFHCINQPKNRLDSVKCGHPKLPCTRPLREGESRLMAAFSCRYWSPIYSYGTATELARTRKPHPYMSISGKNVYYEAEKPCPYYKQFRHYIPPGAIIMNSAKWEAETWIQRKPKVIIEVIDEADDYLDSLSYKTSITQRLLENLEKNKIISKQRLSRLETEYQKIIYYYKEVEYFELSHSPDVESFLNGLYKLLEEAEAANLKEVYFKLGVLLQNQEYAWGHVKTTKNSSRLTFYIPRLDITLNHLRKRSGKLVLMSATRHSDKILKNIFGIQPHHIVAQLENPGTLYLMTPNKEALPLLNVVHRNWQNKNLKQRDKFREKYWETLEEQIQIAPRPCYVIVHAYKYLPSIYTPSETEAKEPCWQHPQHPHVYFSTKMDRGIDLPDDKCRSIILLKYPWPDIGDPVLKTMKKQYGADAYWNYLRDSANRNMLQQCGRAIRNEEDWCQIYSPDENVPKKLKKVWKGRLIETTYPGGIT